MPTVGLFQATDWLLDFVGPVYTSAFQSNGPKRDLKRALLGACFGAHTGRLRNVEHMLKRNFDNFVKG